MTFLDNQKTRTSPDGVMVLQYKWLQKSTIH